MCGVCNATLRDVLFVLDNKHVSVFTGVDNLNFFLSEFVLISTSIITGRKHPHLRTCPVDPVLFLLSPSASSVAFCFQLVAVSWGYAT